MSPQEATIQEAINPFGLSSAELEAVELFHQESVMEPAHARAGHVSNVENIKTGSPEDQIAQLTAVVTELTAQVDELKVIINGNTQASVAAVDARAAETSIKEPGRIAEWFRAKRHSVATVGAIAVAAVFTFGASAGNSEKTAEARAADGPHAAHVDTNQVAASSSAASSERRSSQVEINKTFMRELKAKLPGVKKYAVGHNNIDWKNANNQRGDAAFGIHTIKSQEQLKNFVNSDTKGGVAIRGELREAFRGNPHGLKRAMSGEGYTPVQIKEAAVLRGTTYLVDGQVRESGARAVRPNDVMWVYSGKHTGEINGDASIRAACDQNGFNSYTPQRARVHVPSVVRTPTRAEDRWVSESERTLVVVNKGEKNVVNNVEVENTVNAITTVNNEETTVNVEIKDKPDRPDKPIKPNKPNKPDDIKKLPPRIPGDPTRPNTQDPLSPATDGQETKRPVAGSSPEVIPRPDVVKPVTQEPSSETQNRPVAETGAEPVNPTLPVAVPNTNNETGQGGTVSPDGV